MRLKHYIYRFLLILAIAVIPSITAHAKVHNFNAKLDSAYLLMGKQTAIHLEIIEDNNANGYVNIPNDTLHSAVEKITLLKADTTDLGNNRRQIMQDLIIQSFDSGLYQLKPIHYISGNDTAKSAQLTLKVVPVLVDSLKAIHGNADVSDLESKWWDFLPDWITEDRNWVWIAIAIAIIIAGIICAILLTKKGRQIILPAKKPIPPYEYAIMQLNELKDHHLWENGQEKEYYTRLTEILRDYLERRFGINAMEMTSTQIIEHLSQNQETKEPNRYMKEILQAADFVKFAKVKPESDDNVKAFNSAMQFVEDTKPAPEPEQQPQDTTKETATINDNPGK